MQMDPTPDMVEAVQGYAKQALGFADEYLKEHPDAEDAELKEGNDLDKALMTRIVEDAKFTRSMLRVVTALVFAYTFERSVKEAKEMSKMDTMLKNTIAANGGKIPTV